MNNAEKQRWQEYTDKLYKKDLNDPGNHDGVIIHLEPDIVECEVKRALGGITMNKARESDGIPVELFQILEDDAFTVLAQYARKFGKPFLAQWKAMPKNAQTTT